ncbi:MAG: hypothetical protein R3A52_17415 [Polyangiales bacterium]
MGCRSGSAPTATIDSGQRSRTSNTHGARCDADRNDPAAAERSCGLVATITSGKPTWS